MSTKVDRRHLSRAGHVELVQINRDAQLALLDAAQPLLTPGASVVFVTSHWAHRYGAVVQLPDYEMGEAIARAVADPTLPSGQTVVVGGLLDSLPLRV